MIRIPNPAWRGTVAVLSVAIALVSYRYLTASETRAPGILANAFADPFLVIHVVGGATALLVSPLQFVARFRSPRPGFHRLVGRVYVVGCVAGGLAGIPLALGSTAGPMAAAGFGTLVLGIDFADGYRAIAWLCWVPNVVAVEAYLRWPRRPATPAGMTAA